MPGTAAIARALLKAGAPADGDPADAETPLMRPLADPTRHALARPHLCRRAGPIAEGPSPGGGAGQDQGCGGRQGMTSPSFAGGPRCRAKEFVTNDERCVPGGGLSSTADPAAPSSANLLAENGRSRVDAWLISPPWCRATAPVNGRVRPPAFSAGGIAGYLAVGIHRSTTCVLHTTAAAAFGRWESSSQLC